MLAASIIVHGAHTKNVFYGGKPALIESFADELPGVTLEHFLHLTSIVGPPAPVHALVAPSEEHSGGVAAVYEHAVTFGHSRDGP